MISMSCEMTTNLPRLVNATRVVPSRMKQRTRKVNRKESFYEFYQSGFPSRHATLWRNATQGLAKENTKAKTKD